MPSKPSPLRRLLARKRRILFTLLALALVAYAAVYAAVATAGSPTDRAVTLEDGRELAYLVRNQGAPRRVVLVHGAPATAASWNRLIGAHAGDLRDFEIVAVDRLGYGASDPAAETSLAAHVRSLEPLLEPGAILVGHSYGGPVALRAAAEYPDLVGGVVLVAGATDPNMNDAQWARRAGDAVSLAIPPSWAAANRELLALTGDNRETEPLLARARCPVAVLHGEWDPVCPRDGTVAYLRESLDHLDRFRVETIERGGHNLHISHADRVAELIEWCAQRAPTER